MMALSSRLGPRAPMFAPPPRSRGRVVIRAEWCKGCGFCIEYCPKKVLAFSEQFNPRGYHYPVVVVDDCIDCSLCAALCPDYAIFSVRLIPTVSTAPSAPGITRRGG